MAHRAKMLFAGGGYAEIPLIEAAKRLGYYVISSGNAAAGLGHRFADETRLADFSDGDAMLAIAEDAGVDAVCSSCNDFSALSCAYVAERLDLPGHDCLETSRLLHHKDRFREFSAANGFPVPRAVGVGCRDEAIAAIEELGFPVIVKPVDLTGGKGVARVDAPLEAAPAVEAAFRVTRAKRVVVESFIEGTRHGFSAILRNGRVAFCFVDNEHYFLNPYLVSAASVPSDAGPKVVRQLIEHSERYASLLKLVDGIFHVQFIMRDDQPWIIEICRRPPGDLYVKLVEHATGVSYSEYIVRCAAGLDVTDLCQVEPRGAFVRHCIMPSRPGRLDGIRYDDAIRGHIIDECCWWSRGDVVTADELLRTKFGIVFLAFDDPAQLGGAMDRIHGLIEPIMN